MTSVSQGAGERFKRLFDTDEFLNADAWSIFDHKLPVKGLMMGDLFLSSKRLCFHGVLNKQTVMNNDLLSDIVELKLQPKKLEITLKSQETRIYYVKDYHPERFLKLQRLLKLEYDEPHVSEQPNIFVVYSVGQPFAGQPDAGQYQPYAGHYPGYHGQPYAGQYPGQPYPGQPFPGPPYPMYAPYPGQPYAGPYPGYPSGYPVPPGQPQPPVITPTGPPPNMPPPSYEQANGTVPNQ
eukprot:TRINITY_DN3895_c0_g2_i1.p1 TRINITY_DN3895_c0_g2~~TRINITY_DN3895_c0_g2_i1.p1  ORF type:complete len:237 (+),score=28.40 TRINITY_DN3895_c0_g2_i1:124-834(+)